MRALRFIAWLTVVGLVAGLEGQSVGAHAQPASRPAAADTEQTPPVQVRASFSRTALWVGDHVRYTIELTCAPGVGILNDDLDKAKLRLRGFEILSAGTEQANQVSGASILRFHYELATYEMAPTTLKIDELPVRFYVKRPGQRVEDVVPAGEVRVPPSSIPLRSTVPDEMKAAAIRDTRGHVPLPAWWAWIRPIGIGLIVISIVPVVLWAAAVLHRVGPLKPKWRAWRALRATHLTRKSLTDLRSLDLSEEVARRKAYARLNRLVRDHLSRKLSVPAQALTLAELNAAVRKNGLKLPADVVSSLLEECEFACYCPPGRLPAGNQFRKALEEAEALVTRR